MVRTKYRWLMTFGLLGALSLLLLASGCGPVYVARNDSGYYRSASTASYQQAPSDQWSYLSAHGYWVTTAKNGRVWVPHANQTANWRPYYQGSWDYTEYGWTWVSDESWGWGPYHYGRWTWHDRHHWIWVPGYTWGPAWVRWRRGGGCVGWAPLGPAGGGAAHYTYWVFVPKQRVYRNRVASAVVGPNRAQTVYNQSVSVGAQQRIRNHRGGVTTYNRGPSAANVSRWTKTAVRQTSIRSIPSAVPRRAVFTRPAPRYRSKRTNNNARRAPVGRRVPTYSSSTASRRAAPGTATPSSSRYRPVPATRVVPTRPTPRTPASSTPRYRVPVRRATLPPRAAPPTYSRPSRSSARPTRTAPSHQVPTTRPSVRPTRPAPPVSRSSSSRGSAAPRSDSSSKPYSVKPSSRSSPRSRRARPVRRTRKAPPPARGRSRDR